jgi:hypothetical protein
MTTHELRHLNSSPPELGASRTLTLFNYNGHEINGNWQLLSWALVCGVLLGVIGASHQ